MRKFNPINFFLPLSQFLKSHGTIFIWFTTYVLVSGALQFYTSYPLDSDTPYHVAVGQLIRKHGFLHSFPWTPFSWLADNYTDDKLLFHLLFVPLAGLNWITASRIVGTVAGCAILMSLYLILRVERVRFAGLWAFIPLSSSLPFIFRFLLVRPHLLSITLALIFLWATVRGRYLILAGISAIYPWSYIAFWQLPFLLLIAAETSIILSGKAIRWKPAAVFVAGMVLGIAIHPNAANLLDYNWIVMSDVLFKNAWLNRVGFDMGSELNPYPLGGWVQGLIICVIMAIIAFIYSWRYKNIDTISLGFTIAALGFCILTIRSARFAEYFIPFSSAALALASRFVTWRFLSHAILGISTIYTLLVGAPTLSAISRLPNEMPPGFASFLQKQIPPDSQVFTTSWDVTGLLLVTLPERYFLVALDPTLFYLKDPELYSLWYRITQEAPPGMAKIIREKFGARFVIVDKPEKTKDFNYQLGKEPGVRLVLMSEKWLLFDLNPQSKKNS